MLDMCGQPYGSLIVKVNLAGMALCGLPNLHHSDISPNSSLLGRGRGISRQDLL